MRKFANASTLFHRSECKRPKLFKNSQLLIGDLFENAAEHELRNEKHKQIRSESSSTLLEVGQHSPRCKEKLGTKKLPMHNDFW